jgi:hypothetical protein
MWKRLLVPAFGMALALGALSLGCTDNSGNGTNGGYNPNLKPNGNGGSGGSDMDAASQGGSGGSAPDGATDDTSNTDGSSPVDSLPTDLLDLDSALGN